MNLKNADTLFFKWNCIFFYINFSGHFA